MNLDKSLGLDNMSKMTRNTLNLLFLKYPTRTSMGLLFGITVNFLVDLFKPIIAGVTIISTTAFNVWQTSLFGVFIFNLPTLFRRHRLPEEVEQKLLMIRVAVEEGNLSESQARQLYQALAVEVVSKTRLRSELEKIIPGG